MVEVVDGIAVVLGFEPGPLISSITSKNYRDKVNVIVLTGSLKDERVDRAFSELVRILTMIYGKDFKKKVSICRYDIDVNNFPKAVAQIRTVIKEHAEKGKCLSVSFTGGMRIINLALLIACTLINWKCNPTYEIYLEGRYQSIKMPKIEKALTPTINPLEAEILNAIGEEGETIATLASKLDRDRTTIYRYITKLKELNLVKKERLVIKLNDLGLMFLNTRPKEYCISK